jgi:hypothetical protein
MDKFTISIDAATVGVVFFDDDARIISGLHYSKTSVINAMRSAGQGKGWTCIGCGLNSGMQVLNSPQPGRTGKNPAKVMMTLTDGYNNRPSNYDSHLKTAAAAVHSAGVFSFAIGVGGYNINDLNTVATKLNGEPQVFRVNNFAELNTLIEGLVQTTCMDLNPLPCGSSCFGFCSCGSACVCPKCPNKGRCINSNCTASGQISNGCVDTPVNCDTGDRCYTHTCQVDGCHHDKISCDDGKKCTLDSCSPTTGCIHLADLCDDHNACTRDYCVEPGGCMHEYLCDDHNDCTKDTCNNITGCLNTPITCDDGLPCTQNLCNKVGGCDFSKATVCNDNSVCTEDSCHPTYGCMFERINCEDGDICTDNPCDPVTGCQSVTIPCEACKQHKPNCTDKINHRCEEGKCVQDGPSGWKCEYTKYTDTKCNSGNKCIIDSCDLVTETCSHVNKVCDYINCTDVACDPLTGECKRTDRNCALSDPCWIGFCDKALDTCRRTPLCEAKTCQIATCTVTGGVGQCTYSDLPCSSGSKCIDDFCD